MRERLKVLGLESVLGLGLGYHRIRNTGPHVRTTRRPMCELHRLANYYQAHICGELHRFGGAWAT